MRIQAINPLKKIMVLAVCVTITACATGPGRIQSPTSSGSMLYGSLELPAEVRDQIHWVIIYKLGEVYVTPFKNPIKARVSITGSSKNRLKRVRNPNRDRTRLSNGNDR